MGFIINADLETNLGPTQELYVRVEGFTFNKVTAQLSFQITYWIDRESAIKHNRIYLDEKVKGMVGLVQNKVIYFDTEESEGNELTLAQFHKVLVSTEEETEIPIFESQIVEDKVPYVSFDDNGDEITKYRIITKPKKVQVGSKKESRSVIDLKAFDDIYGYCYSRLRKYLSTFFAEEAIIKQ